MAGSLVAGARGMPPGNPTKTVLIISYDFPPQGGTGPMRAAKFVKYLPEYGWNPVVICSQVVWYPDPALAAEVPPAVPVFRVPWPLGFERLFVPGVRQLSGPVRPASSFALSVAATRRAGAKLIRRLLVPDPMILWSRAARSVAAKVFRDLPCDVILTTSPPHSTHLIGSWLHRRFHVPWIADFRDPWTIDAGAVERFGRFNMNRQRQMERRILAEADRAIVVTDAIEQRTHEVFGSAAAGRLLTLTNGFDPAEFADLPSREGSDWFTLVHVGSIVGTRVENAFPEGLRLALESSPVFRQQARVRFIGATTPEFRSRLAASGGKVEFIPYLEHRQAVEAMGTSSLLLLLIANTDEGALSLPNKFFEYLAARRPILAVTPPGLVSDLIRHESLGAVGAPDDPAEIARAVLTMFEELRVRPGSYAPSPELLARFDRRVLAGRLAALLNETARAQGRTS